MAIEDMQPQYWQGPSSKTRYITLKPDPSRTCGGRSGRRARARQGRTRLSVRGAGRRAPAKGYGKGLSLFYMPVEQWLIVLMNPVLECAQSRSLINRLASVLAVPVHKSAKMNTPKNSWGCFKD